MICGNALVNLQDDCLGVATYPLKDLPKGKEHAEWIGLRGVPYVVVISLLTRVVMVKSILYSKQLIGEQVADTLALLTLHRGSFHSTTPCSTNAQRTYSERKRYNTRSSSFHVPRPPGILSATSISDRHCSAHTSSCPTNTPSCPTNTSSCPTHTPCPADACSTIWRPHWPNSHCTVRL